MRCLILVLGLLGAVQAQATDYSVLVGYQHNTDFEISDSIEESMDLNAVGDDLGVEGGLALSLAVDFVFNNNPDQRIGLYLTHHQTQFESGAGLQDEDMEITHLHFTAMNYYPKGKWEPFILAGVGAAYFSPADKTLKDSTRVSAQIATGANFRVSQNLLLRLEARWIPTFFNGSSAGICSGGCTIALKSDVYSQFQTNLGLQYRF